METKKVGDEISWYFCGVLHTAEVLHVNEREGYYGVYSAYGPDMIDFDNVEEDEHKNG